MPSIYSDGGSWLVIGGVALAAGALVVACAAGLGNFEARARAEEQLRADAEARYGAFCDSFKLSAGDRARCIAALRELREWEDEEERTLQQSYF